MKKVFEGVGVALVTPLIDGRVDYVSLRTLIEKVILEGASAIVILGTTGEGSLIKDNDRQQIILFTKKLIAGRVKLIVGTGSNNMETAIYETCQAKNLGADACLVVTPYYSKTSQSGLIEYYSRLNELNIPLIVYNVPSRTGMNVELKTLKSIMLLKNVYGIKESSSDINRIIELHKLCKNRIAVYSGEDKLNFVFYSLGARGAISVTANIYTKQVVDIYNHCISGEFGEAREKQDDLDELNDALFIETNPIPIKFLLKYHNLIRSSEANLPLVELSKESQKQLLEKDKEFNKKADG